MLRLLIGGVSLSLLALAGAFLWMGQAEGEDPIPRAPPALAAAPADDDAAETAREDPRAPAATEKSKEEKRFGRADKDKDGRITLEELYLPRRKAFAKLDLDKNNQLSFEEWAITTGEKFAKGDADKSAWLSPAEFETTKPKTKAKPRASCAC